MQEPEQLDASAVLEEPEERGPRSRAPGRSSSRANARMKDTTPTRTVSPTLDRAEGAREEMNGEMVDSIDHRAVLPRGSRDDVDGERRRRNVGTRR